MMTHLSELREPPAETPFSLRDPADPATRNGSPQPPFRCGGNPAACWRCGGLSARQEMKAWRGQSLLRKEHGNES